jgi:hypothetical protein
LFEIDSFQEKKAKNKRATLLSHTTKNQWSLSSRSTTNTKDRSFRFLLAFSNFLFCCFFKIGGDIF